VGVCYALHFTSVNKNYKNAEDEGYMPIQGNFKEPAAYRERREAIRSRIPIWKNLFLA
jgi:hypothetical protein